MKADNQARGRRAHPSGIRRTLLIAAAAAGILSATVALQASSGGPTWLNDTAYLNDIPVARMPTDRAFGHSSMFIGNGGHKLEHVEEHDGRYNTFTGMRSGRLMRRGSYMAGYGFETLERQRDGMGHSAFGEAAMINHVGGQYGVAVGHKAYHGAEDVVGDWSIAIGGNAAILAKSGDGFIGIGAHTFRHIDGAHYSIALGHAAGHDLISGPGNIFIGNQAGRGIKTGPYNVVVGGVGNLPENLSNHIIWADGAGTIRAAADARGHWQVRGAFGYGNPVGTSGTGGSAVQSGNKTAQVVLNKASGRIVTSAAPLAPAEVVSFDVANELVSDTDVPMVALASGGTRNGYEVAVAGVWNGGFRVQIRNVAAQPLSEALALNVSLMKGVAD